MLWYVSILAGSMQHDLIRSTINVEKLEGAIGTHGTPGSRCPGPEKDVYFNPYDVFRHLSIISLHIPQ